MLVAAYGLVNANAKWQVQSDEAMHKIGLVQCRQTPQLFHMDKNGKLVLLAAKVIDDIQVAGSEYHIRRFVTEFDKHFKLGTVVEGPGKMRFFGSNVEQAENFTVRTNADDKLNGLNEYYLSRYRGQQFQQTLNAIEKSHFASTNSSLGWIGSAASPICSFYASILQQKAPETAVSHLVDQINIVRKLQKLGTVKPYPRPTDKNEYELTELAFADASKPSEYGKLGIVIGLLVGDFKQDSIFHTITWMSHKAKRPTKSVPAAEILAASEAIDESKVIAFTLRELLNVKVKVQVCVESKDLFTSLSTQRKSIDRSIRSDVAFIRYEIQVGAVDKITWIPGSLTLPTFSQKLTVH